MINRSSFLNEHVPDFSFGLRSRWSINPVILPGLAMSIARRGNHVSAEDSRLSRSSRRDQPISLPESHHDFKLAVLAHENTVERQANSVLHPCVNHLHNMGMKTWGVVPRVTPECPVTLAPWVAGRWHKEAIMSRATTVGAHPAASPTGGAEAEAKRPRLKQWSSHAADRGSPSGRPSASLACWPRWSPSSVA